MYQNQRIKIWVDDIRPVPKGCEGAKSVNDTIALIEKIESDGGIIELLDLDHGLGDYASNGGDAIKILDFLVEEWANYINSIVGDDSPEGGLFIAEKSDSIEVSMAGEKDELLQILAASVYNFSKIHSMAFEDDDIFRMVILKILNQE